VSYGCGDDEPITPGTPDAATNGVDAGPIGSTHTHFVTSSLIVGPTREAAANRAFDVDGNGTKEPRRRPGRSSSAIPSGNSNGQIEVNEITGNATIGTFLVPDVDILNASGGAGTDGTKDSLSIAVGFECNGAVFTTSSEQ
jgi:hypothetical protein